MVAIQIQQQQFIERGLPLKNPYTLNPQRTDSYSSTVLQTFKPFASIKE